MPWIFVAHLLLLIALAARRHSVRFRLFTHAVALSATDGHARQINVSLQGIQTFEHERSNRQLGRSGRSIYHAWINNQDYHRAFASFMRQPMKSANKRDRCLLFFLFHFEILPRMGENKAEAHRLTTTTTSCVVRRFKLAEGWILLLCAWSTVYLCTELKLQVDSCVEWAYQLFIVSAVNALPLPNIQIYQPRNASVFRHQPSVRLNTPGQTTVWLAQH